VKAVVGFYGIYDMLAQWNHDAQAVQKQENVALRNRDLIPRPHDSITEQFLGATPARNPRIYSESSPISHATADASTAERHKARFLLIKAPATSWSTRRASRAPSQRRSRAPASPCSALSLPKPPISGCPTRSSGSRTASAP